MQPGEPGSKQQRSHTELEADTKSNVLEITRNLEVSVDKLSDQLDKLSKDLDARFDKLSTLLK